MKYEYFTNQVSADEFLITQKRAGFFGYVLKNRADKFEVRTWK